LAENNTANILYACGIVHLPEWTLTENVFPRILTLKHKNLSG